MMKRIACIGECMIELFEDAGTGPATMRRTYGGDTLNSAVYLARELAAGQARVHYVTVLGDDPYSTEMLEGWAAEGIDNSLTERLPGRFPASIRSGWTSGASGISCTGAIARRPGNSL